MCRLPDESRGRDRGDRAYSDKLLPVSEREKRLATNEVLFREMNERVEERLQQVAAGPMAFDIVCECGDLDCTHRITLTTDEYVEAHASPKQFTVVPGHAIADIEDVVARTDRFEVVRKHGVAGDVAAALDGS
jgi:hypothetical protein